MYSFNRRTRSKAFLISNIFILILLLILTNLASIINLFAGDNNLNHAEIGIVLDVDDSEGFDYKTQFELYFKQINLTDYNVTIMEDEETAIVLFNEDKYDALLLISGINLNNLDVDYYGDNQNVQMLIEHAFDELLIKHKNLNYQRPVFHNITLDMENDEMFKTNYAMGISMILVMPMFILIVMGTQFLGVDIVEEKSSKAIETIISSVPAHIHYSSKIASNFLFILFQTFLMIIYALISGFSNKLLFGNSPSSNAFDISSIFKELLIIYPNFWLLLLISIIILLIGSLLYLIIASLFASMTTSQEDYQQFQGPLMLVLVIGFYSSIMATAIGSAAKGYITVLTFIPFFTPLVVPYALFNGFISPLLSLIALLILCLFIYLMSKIISPIYKVSILNYDQSKFFKRVKNNFKKAFYKEKKRKE